jgi:hypothetical protein
MTSLNVDTEQIWDYVKDMTEEDLVPDPGPTPTEEQTPDKTTTVAIVLELKDVAKNGGYLRIARKHGVSMGTVKIIHEAMQKRIGEISQVTP